MGRRSTGKGSDLDLVKELIRHPGWLVLERKAKIILENSDQRLHTSTKEGFEKSQGIYEGVKLFHDLIVVNPLDIADFQGVVKLRRK